VRCGEDGNQVLQGWGAGGGGGEAARPQAWVSTPPPASTKNKTKYEIPLIPCLATARYAPTVQEHLEHRGALVRGLLNKKQDCHQSSIRVQFLNGYKYNIYCIYRYTHSVYVRTGV
jgi:hypothetical protein